MGRVCERVSELRWGTTNPANDGAGLRVRDGETEGDLWRRWVWVGVGKRSLAQLVANEREGTEDLFSRPRHTDDPVSEGKRTKGGVPCCRYCERLGEWLVG
jgi:hypothetical protein